MKQSFSRRVLLAASTMLALALPVAALTAPAAQAVNDYPYTVANQVDRWGFYTRNCTSYVAWRMERNGVAFSNTMVGPNGTRGQWGNANNWDDNARRIGYRVDGSPAVGAIAQWNEYEGGAGGYGHVAYVERVNSDGSVYVSEYNFGVAYGYSERTVRPPRFIHVKDLPGSAPAEHHYFQTTGDGLRVRSGPSTGASIVRTLGAAGTTVDIRCQTRSSSSVNGSTIWDNVGDGYITDYYVNTPVYNDFSPGIPHC